MVRDAGATPTAMGCTLIALARSRLARRRRRPRVLTPPPPSFGRYALAQCVHGEAIHSLIKPSQQASLQEQLHAQALARLSTAMTYATNAGEASLLLGAAQRFWRHCVPFLSGESDAADRALLRGPVGTALKELEGLAPELQSKVTDLRVRL